jgi:hypothetical protein
MKRTFTRDELEIGLLLLMELEKRGTDRERQTAREAREIVQQMLIRIDDEKSTH